MQHKLSQSGVHIRWGPAPAFCTLRSRSLRCPCGRAFCTLHFELYVSQRAPLQPQKRSKMWQKGAKRSKTQRPAPFILRSALFTSIGQGPCPHNSSLCTRNSALPQGPPSPSKKYSKLRKSSQKFANGPTSSALIKHTRLKNSPFSG
jgi:hypothetical protein